MSGPFGAGGLQLFGGTGGFYPHTIDQSLRFEGGDSAVLSRTPSSTGNRRTWTWSGWVKRSVLGTAQNFYTLFSAGPYTGSSTHFAFYYSGSKIDIISFYQYTGGYQILYETDQLFRDSSAWYHFVVEVDTTDSTSTDRVKIYLNGTRITSFQTSTAPSLNLDTYLNLSSETNYVGSSSRASTDNLNGYLSEVNFIDGTALDASSFGETKAGIWIPKDTSGLTFGTNGFRLKFQDSSALGDDTSGNGNDFSSSGLAATDVVLDSPTNNFATMNSLVPATDFTFAEGNLKATVGSTAWDTAASTYFLNSGKWYAEFHILDTNRVAVGAVSNLYDPTTFIGNDAEGIGYYDQGYTYANGGNVTTGLTTFTNGDLIQVALNLDDSEISFYKANTLIKTENLPSSTGEDFSIAVSGYGSGSGAIVNFGQDSSFAGNETAQGNTDGNGIGDFYYSPPSGFLALCSANLPDPAIDPAQNEEPADYFNTVLYTGNGSTQSITGVGFQPDWVWGKQRSGGTNSHSLHDVVRGATNQLYSNLTLAEFNNVNSLTSFDSDGFSVGSHGMLNSSGESVVAWNWLAGGSAVTNNDGDLTSSVSANTKAGFSIVTWTTGTGTVGHGLNSTPELIIEKKRGTSSDWLVQTTVIDGSNDYLRLNTTAAKTNGVGASPTTTVFTPNIGASTAVAYCFHSVEGYSKIGTYTGNGSTTGPFVYTGFRPAWLLVKRTDSASTNGWYIYDNKRQNFGTLVDAQLYANLASAEDDGNRDLDFTSNGFKPRLTDVNVNASGGSYIYLAIAEQPFKYSNAR